MNILFASKNKEKCAELKAICQTSSFDEKRNKYFTLNDFPDYEDVEETGFSFEENALIKLKAAMSDERFKDYIIISEDSGLYIPALQGRPGIYSARYGSENETANERVLREMKGVNLDERTAYLHSAVAIKHPEYNIAVFTGISLGSIAYVEVGDNGFAYDSIFIPQGDYETIAEKPFKNFYDKFTGTFRAKALHQALSHILYMRCGYC